MQVASRVAKQLKTENLRKLGKLRIMSKLHGSIIQRSVLLLKKKILSILAKDFLKTEIELFPQCSISHESQSFSQTFCPCLQKVEIQKLENLSFFCFILFCFFIAKIIIPLSLNSTGKGHYKLLAKRHEQIICLGSVPKESELTFAQLESWLLVACDLYQIKFLNFNYKKSNNNNNNNNNHNNSNNNNNNCKYNNKAIASLSNTYAELLFTHFTFQQIKLKHSSYNSKKVMKIEKELTLLSFYKQNAHLIVCQECALGKNYF